MVLLSYGSLDNTSVSKNLLTGSIFDTAFKESPVTYGSFTRGLTSREEIITVEILHERKLS